MKINTTNLKKYLKRIGKTASQFSIELGFGCSAKVLDYFCGTGTLDEKASRKFINKVGAETAIDLIDWEAMHVRKPRRKEIFTNAY